jgi:uncharacterized protein
MTTTINTGEATLQNLRAGDMIRVATPDGKQGGDLSFAGFDQSLTRNINGWERYRRPYLVFHAAPGMRLFDGRGEPVLEVVEARGAGKLDIMLPGCWRELYDDGRPGCRDLVSEALGIERHELTGMMSFFVSSEVTDDYYNGLAPTQVEPGDYILLRALVDVPVAVSACPDVDIPGWEAGGRLEVGVESP